MQKFDFSIIFIWVFMIEEKEFELRICEYFYLNNVILIHII